jgi:hypothetical protein
MAHGFKYQYGDDESGWDDEDKAVGQDFPLIALDLDTTSLGPLVAYISWHARNERGVLGFGNAW